LQSTDDAAMTFQPLSIADAARRALRAWSRIAIDMHGAGIALYVLHRLK
jgi:hypothetical protein